MATQERFLNETGVTLFVEQMFNQMDATVSSAIVTTISDQSTNTTVPGTLAIYNFVRTLIGNISTASFVIVLDGQELPTNSDTNKFYLWRNTTSDPWGVYLFFEEKWHFLTELNIQMEDFWAKSELVALTNAQIMAIINAARP